MKKRIVFGIIAALALLFVLPGCSDPVDTMTVNKIANPGALTAEAYEGMNLLTWSPVIDAETYTVYRKDPVTKKDILLKGGISDLYYRDFVRIDNKLVHDQNYEYSVVAVTTKGSALNGVSKKSVKANIPGTLTITAPLATDISPVVVASDSKNPGDKDTLVVTVSNIKPNYNYDITYTYGEGTVNTITRSFSGINRIGDYLSDNNVIIAKFPVIGGKNSVNVTATFGGFAGAYYTNFDAVSVSANGGTFVDSLPKVGGFSAVRVEDAIQLTWGKVEGATTFDVYKIKTDSPFVLTGPDATTNDINMISDWEKLVGTANWDSSNSRYVLFDTPTPADGTGYYLYAIIAGNGTTAKSAPAYTPATLNNSWISMWNPNFSVSAVADAVTVTLDKVQGTTYKIEYIEVKSHSDDTDADLDDYIPVGSIWSSFSVPSGNGLGRTETEDLTDGKNYVFRLSATRYGITTTETEMKYDILNDGDFSVE